MSRTGCDACHPHLRRGLLARRALDLRFARPASLLVLVAVLAVDRRHARQHALAQVAQAGFLGLEVVIGPVHLREQGVVGIERCARASDLGTRNRSRPKPVPRLGFGSMELRAASRVCALSSTGEVFLVLAIGFSPFNGSKSPETVPQFRKKNLLETNKNLLQRNRNLLQAKGTCYELTGTYCKGTVNLLATNRYCLAANMNLLATNKYYLAANVNLLAANMNLLATNRNQ